METEMVKYDVYKKVSQMWFRIEEGFTALDSAKEAILDLSGKNPQVEYRVRKVETTEYTMADLGIRAQP